MCEGTETGELNVVTGAFGFTGKYITRRLLAEGKRVLTLTGHPHRDNPFGDRVSVAPFNFDDPEALAASLRGASVLFNSYWVRFPRGRVTYELAVANSETLIQAAKRAGVRRIVHISIANPSKDSPFPYYRGKAMVEEAIVDSGIPHAILRPTVIFGTEGILINNIAWLLRRLPAFAVPGSGNYRLQPVYVEDVADMAVRAAEGDANTVVDAAGPEVYSFNDLVRLLANAVGSRALVVHLPPQPGARPLGARRLRPSGRGADPRRAGRADGQPPRFRQTTNRQHSTERLGSRACRPTGHQLPIRADEALPLKAWGCPCPVVHGHKAESCCPVPIALCLPNPSPQRPSR